MSLASAGTALADTVQVAPGLEYRDFDCTVRGHQLTFHELRLQPGRRLKLRAIPNPSARPNPRCRDGYGGTGIQTLLGNPELSPGFQILGVTNGTFFHETTRHLPGGETAPGYASNSLLWSDGGGFIAPLRGAGGSRLFIADAQGGHEVQMTFAHCRKETCARLRFPGQSEPTARAYNSQDLIPALRARFPTMTLAVQSKIPLMNGEVDAQGHFTHYTACPAAGSSDWRCAATYRTVLCSRTDGTISLLTTPSAYPLDLADGLRAGGACHAECVLFYNMDGGGSTQMAYLDPASGATPSYPMSGRRIETSQEGCSAYRPVDNYLVIGRSR